MMCPAIGCASLKQLVALADLPLRRFQNVASTATYLMTRAPRIDPRNGPECHNSLEYSVEQAFSPADGKVKAKLMRGPNRTNYFKGDTFEALELPYEGHDLSMIGDLSMTVLLPNKADGLPAFEKRLTAANLTQWLGKLSDHRVDVTLPRFKLTSEFMLKDVLSKMGMSIAFDSDKADFNGMTTRERLFISHVVHKAFVDVNEAGTEAAASTATVIENTSASAPPLATFRADHPFVYLIRDNRTGSILFLGRVVNPSPVDGN
jgi:serpin B